MKIIDKINKKYSLKTSMIIIILTCWILPVGIIGFTTRYFIKNTINRQIIERVNQSVKLNKNFCTNRIDSAIACSRYASYDNTILNAYENYEKTGENYYLYPINQFLDAQYKYDDKFLITALYFYDDPQNFYHTYNSVTHSYNDVIKFKEKASIRINNFAKTLGTNIGFINIENDMYMVRNLVRGTFYAPYAVLVMKLNSATMFDSMKTVAWATDATVWLNNYSINIKGQKLDPEKLNIPLYSRMNTQAATYEQTKNVIFGCEQKNGYKFSYVIGVDQSMFLKEMQQLTFVTILLIVLIVPLLSFSLHFFYKNVSRPIRSLVSGLHEIEQGKFGHQITEEFSNNEFDYLQHEINEMSAQLHNQFEKIYMEELALRDAKIMALQSQINPHFLNNTLEIINWEARLAGNTDVSRMIEALSTMLDAAMDRKGSPTIHLSQEMMYVNSYLYIISNRLGKRLTITKIIDESLLDLYVPRLILQPIIENAVEHGIKPKQKGNITIRIYKEDEKLILEVENDGVMTEEDEKRIELLLREEYDPSQESSGSLGIRNVHQRLRIIYGEGSGLTIKRLPKGNSLAKITILHDQSEQ